MAGWELQIQWTSRNALIVKLKKGMDELEFQMDK